ncbi:hypothetical protein T484DRAFT_1971656 [Baffinella frigidus]|nr:hypothetical protein T484DRAFT_1971656 [Cryptophyta sp. CCMP2293]
MGHQGGRVLELRGCLGWGREAEGLGRRPRLSGVLQHSGHQARFRRQLLTNKPSAHLSPGAQLRRGA